MTTFTGPELATRVLRDAGLIGADETPSAEDLAWAEETAQGEIAALSAKGIVIWNGSDDSIPLEYLTPLSRCIVLSIAPSFGLSDPASAQMARKEVEKELRALSATPGTGAVAEADYF